MIIELAFDVSTKESELLYRVLDALEFPYYIEPPTTHYSLESLEADCEGK